MPTSTDILIIGAGAAGLHAGFLLHQQGIDFRILEAASQYGGRLGKIEGFADFPLDTGAQWLHGKKSLVGKLIKSTGTTITRDKSKERYWFEGRLKKKTPVDLWGMFEEADLPDVSYAEYARQVGLSPAYSHILQAVAGDFGASPESISAYWKIKEEEAWSSGGKDYKFARTYFDLIDEQWAQPILEQLILNTPVTSIDYRGEKIQVTDSHGGQWEAKQVLITVPITILKAGDIAFSPALPMDKILAFQHLGMEAGMKVFLKFSERFYHDAVIGGEQCAAYADETVGKTGQDQVLLAFIMGKQAQRLSDIGSEEKIVAVLLQELDEMYEGKASSLFQEARVIDWTRHPYIRGAYSYSTVGMGTARAVAAQAVNGKLFFAGEAMALNGHHQTVHGAAESAAREVNRMLQLA
ncbi:MAG: NAD(P)/FAD-dependent oxidoreductase [Bacteroidota bacterium]